MPSTTIVTGAAGYLGRKVAAQLLQGGESGSLVVGTDLAQAWPWPELIQEGDAFRSVPLCLMRLILQLLLLSVLLQPRPLARAHTHTHTHTHTHMHTLSRNHLLTT